MSFRRRPQYLLRFDDVCPTYPWAAWRGVEEVLIANNIRPIMAIIPDNRDVTLHKGPVDVNFWNRVRNWQEMGWTIGLHGHQHLYVSKSSGMVGLNRYSEFAGLSFEEQYEKLRTGLEILARERVQPTCWVAPAHTFDENTLRALKIVGLRTISDGFQLWPHTDSRGLFWIPQQLGRFYSMPIGTWTICIHPDDRLFSDHRLFRQKIETFRENITDIKAVELLYSGNNSNAIGEAFAQTVRWAKVAKAAMSSMSDGQKWPG